MMLFSLFWMMSIPKQQIPVQKPGKYFVNEYIASDFPSEIMIVYWQ
jgi:hypothetical protein